MSFDLEHVTALMQAGYSLVPDALYLDVGGCRMAVRSNSAQLLENLGRYFSHVRSPEADTHVEVLAIERDPMDTGVSFVDWKREPGKTGRKDAYFDFPGGRLVQKVRTGMLFLQSDTARIAAGPCSEYDNQVINFINTQYMNWLQHRGWLICHAAGLVRDGHGLAIAGLSGGGKSTLMLQLLENPSAKYLTNDRLFVKAEAGVTQAVGIPKLPRINPGTIVSNPRLEHLIEEPRRAELLALPKDELWHLEEKHDVYVESVYGAGRIVQKAELKRFLVLNWDRGAGPGFQVVPARLRERADLLGAIMKSPGPFYQFEDGSFFQDTMPLDPEPYHSVLADVEIFEVSGGVDTAGLASYCFDQLF